MATKFSHKIVDWLIANGTIKAEDREIYLYGLQQGLIMILNIITTIIIGFCLSMVWQSIVFMVAYIPLRSFAGGYHARTQLKCYILSIVLTLAVLMMIKFFPATNVSIMILTGIASGIIAWLSPMEDSNKPLDEIEVKVYGKKTRVILIVEICVIIILLLLKVYTAALTIAISLFALSVMLILGGLAHLIGHFREEHLRS
ncbi:MAG TPA: accessory gene regulator B family protein [Clostridiales bacterium]|nr:accessory gene regulator B family protein [Clostridiales bacterium]